jgi:hypothetical protein
MYLFYTAPGMVVGSNYPLHQTLASEITNIHLLIRERERERERENMKMKGITQRNFVIYAVHPVLLEQ